MPGILPMKVIKVGSSAQARIAQACDRCRSKKIRCDGFRPSCSQCANVGFECKTSDKLSRRAFPRGYTESLEERVRALETEIRELKDLLDAKDDKIDMLSKLHPSGAPQRQASYQSFSDSSQARQSPPQPSETHFRVHQSSSLHKDSEHEDCFLGTSNNYALLESLKVKASEVGRSCPEFDPTSLAPNAGPSPGMSPPSANSSAPKGPSRLLSDQMVNIFFQEWAPIFPVLHRPSFLATYEQYVTDSAKLEDAASLIQLNLVFGIAALSNKTRITYDTSSIESYWFDILEIKVKKNSMVNLQSLVLAQMYCIQTGDWARALRYREISVGMACFLGLNQSQKRFTLDILPAETRKKVFWSLYTLDSFISAFLGTPRSLNDHDVHCEFPIDVDDEYISEQGIQPALPGEFTKLSTALSVFEGARILSKVLAELYPSHTTYEVSTSTMSSLEDELDTWSKSLPPHLRMQFTDEKPSTHVISSRCPLLSLTYHYIRTLIHRPAACFAPAEMSSASTVALAGSSKHIIQILQLLDERNLSFSFCLNKDELLISAGAGVILQSLNLNRESKLLKDSQKTVCTALEILKRRNATEFTEFRRISCPLVHLNPERRLQSPSSDSEINTRVKTETHPIATQYTSLSRSTDQVSHNDNLRFTMPMTAAPPTMFSGRSASTSKRFRAIIPSKGNSHPSSENAASASPKSSAGSGRQMSVVNDRPASTPSAASSAVNLDFFRFPADSSSIDMEKRKMLSVRDRPMYQDFEKILSSFGGEQVNVASQVHDWYSLSEGVHPMDDPNLSLAKSYAEIPRSASYETWPLTSIPQDLNTAPPLEPLKAHSLFSCSDDSLTSGEDFSSLDWGPVSGEGDDTFQAMMTSLTPEEVNAFGLSSTDDTT